MVLLLDEIASLDMSGSFEEKIISDSESEFTFKNLVPGFGVTIGNVLRRALLLSVPGTGFTSMRVEGAEHEFASVDGVSCDLTYMIAMLKKVVIKGFCQRQYTAVLEAQGPCSVFADMILFNGELEIVNKDFVLFDLSEGRSVRIELTVESGYGYKNLIDTDYSRVDRGIILIDTIFNPVISAYFEEKEEIDGTEILVLKLKTNGAVSPRYALTSAVKTISSIFSDIYQEDKSVSTEDSASTGDGFDADDDNPDSILNKSIRNLDRNELSTRAINALSRISIHTVRHLASADISKVLAKIAEIGNAGAKTREDILAFVKKYELANVKGLQTNVPRYRRAFEDFRIPGVDNRRPNIIGAEEWMPKRSMPYDRSFSDSLNSMNKTADFFRSSAVSDYERAKEQLKQRNFEHSLDHRRGPMIGANEVGDGRERDEKDGKDK